MKNLYYLYLVMFKGWIKTDDFGLSLIKFGLVYNENKPQVISLGQGHYLVGPPIPASKRFKVLVDDRTEAYL